MSTLIKPARAFTDELLQPYRQQGDAPADTVITAVVEAEGREGLRSLMAWLTDPAALSLQALAPSVLHHFFTTYSVLPAWANTGQMAKGMAFFQKHAQQIGLILGCFSLPYCYLGANGAQVLWLTERIKNDTTRRLHETGEWVFAVNDPREWTTKTAMFRTLKVRLLHAAVRWFSLHSGLWQLEWGHPVNQEDMAGTNLAFSYIVLRGLRKLGIVASEAEEEAYLHHINVIGFLNGVSDELIPKNLRQAYLLDRAIARRQFMVSEAGQGLTRALLDAIAKQGSQAVANRSGSQRPETVRNLAAGEMRFFLGDHYADWLSIPDLPVEKRLAGLLGRLSIFSTKKP